jgi:hypothetical protein
MAPIGRLSITAQEALAVLGTTRSRKMFCVTAKYRNIGDAILSYTLMLKSWKKWVLCCECIWHSMEIVVTMLAPRSLSFGKVGGMRHDS